MKGVRPAWIPGLIATLPMVALILHFTPIKARWLWQTNVLPMAFVLSNTSYLHHWNAVLTLEDGTVVNMDRSKDRQIITNRFDKTVFNHFVRHANTLSSQPAEDLLKKFFCLYSEKKKKVRQFDFTIVSEDGQTMLRERAACK